MPGPLRAGAAALMVGLAAIGPLPAARAQVFDNRPIFDNRPTIRPPAIDGSAPGADPTGACPRWLDDPVVRQAVQEAEAEVRQEIGNQVALAQMMSTPALRDPAVLADKARDRVSNTVLRVYLQQSASPRRSNEAGDYANAIRRMAPDVVASCLPGIAAILAETQNQVAGADRAEADRQAHDRTPARRMVLVYRGYAALRDCLRSRTGRQLVYVTQADVDEAKRRAKAVEQRLARDNPGLDLDALWTEAVKPEALPGDLLGMFARLDLVGRHDVEAGEYSDNGRAYCQGARRAVEANHRELFPEEAVRRKDW